MNPAAVKRIESIPLGRWDRSKDILLLLLLCFARMGCGNNGSRQFGRLVS